MSAMRTLPLFLSASLASIALCASAAEQSLPTEPRKRLEALQHSLIDAAMASRTQVRTAAWVDSTGQLHENTRITSDMKVRSVRVLPYAQNEANNTTLFVADNGKTSANEEVCRGVEQRYRREATLDVAMRITANGTERYDWNKFLSQARSRFVAQAGASRKWLISTPAILPENTYDRLLTGATPDQMPYQMTIEILPPGALGVEPVRPARARSISSETAQSVQNFFKDEPPAKRSPIPFVMRLSIVERSSQSVIWQDIAPLFYPEAEISTNSQPLPPGLLSELDIVLQRWHDKIDKVFSCKPLQFNVLQEAAGSWVINGGQLAGVSVGDQMLLLNREFLPARILEPDSGQHMALVEVVSVKNGLAKVKKLAGPKDMSKAGDWVATPF